MRRVELRGDRDSCSGVRNNRAYLEIKSGREKHSSRAEVKRITRGTDMHRVAKRVISQCNSPKQALSLMSKSNAFMYALGVNAMTSVGATGRCIIHVNVL